jgi:hypothetical protein
MKKFLETMFNKQVAIFAIIFYAILISDGISQTISFVNLSVNIGDKKEIFFSNIDSANFSIMQVGENNFIINDRLSDEYIGTISFKDNFVHSVSKRWYQGNSAILAIKALWNILSKRNFSSLEYSDLGNSRLTILNKIELLEVIEPEEKAKSLTITLTPHIKIQLIVEQKYVQIDEIIQKDDILID